MSGGTRMSAGRAVQAILNGSGATGLGDRELLERLQDRGSLAAEAAGAALMARHGPMVRRVCRGILGDDHLASDASQTTFLLLVEKAGSIRDPEGLHCWLHGVASRTARSLKASEARRRRLDAARSPTPSNSRDSSTSQAERMREAIEGLPTRFGEVIAMHHLDELGCEAISSHLGLSVGTVKSRLSRGRALLRARLARWKDACVAMPGLLRPLRWPWFFGLVASAVVWGSLGGILDDQRHQGGAAAETAVVAEPSKDSTRRIRAGDVLWIEFAESLPGRPITGKFVVDPDGTIALATYGAVEVSGRSTGEARSVLIRKMWALLSDEDLGVRRADPRSGEWEDVEPSRSSMVYVDFAPEDPGSVIVLGDVAAPGRQPLDTHGLTVLDLLQRAGGIRAGVHRTRITLVRRSPSASPRELTVRLAEIMAGDVSTNYRLEQGDVLKVRSMRAPGKGTADTLSRRAKEIERLRKRVAELEEELRKGQQPHGEAIR